MCDIRKLFAPWWVRVSREGLTTFRGTLPLMAVGLVLAGAVVVGVVAGAVFG